MNTMVIRRACLILLLLCGSGSLIYGSRFHNVTVYEEKEREFSIPIPSPFSFGMPDDVNPFEPPPAQGTRDEKTEDSGAPGATSETEEDPFKTSSPPGGQAPGSGPSGMPPFFFPDLTFKKVTERYLEAREEPEWVLVREVTFGGVTRLANGDLKRTYSGKPPALCPT